jgi:hypothetical protein
VVFGINEAGLNGGRDTLGLPRPRTAGGCLIQNAQQIVDRSPSSGFNQAGQDAGAPRPAAV